jgi:cytochrome oxidase assembly protein ShyY1
VTASQTGGVLTRRSLGLGILALVLVTVMVVLGLWQLSVFDDRQQRDGEKQLEREPIPLTDVMGPDDAYPADAVGRPVIIEGRYVADEEVYVQNLPGHDDAFAVATPLVDDTGSAILVVRGSTDDPERAPPPPPGPVVVTGILEPSTVDGAMLDDDRVTQGIRIATLVSGFGTDLYSGYAVLIDSDPTEALPAVEPPVPDPSLLAGLRNLAYALQWWVFAAFVVFMWWRIVREGHESDDADAASEDSDDVG